MRKMLVVCLLGGSSFAATSETLASLPLTFEQDAHARWTARAPGAAFLLEGSGAKMIVADRLISLRFVGASDSTVAGEKALPVSASYFHGDQYRSARMVQQLRAKSVYTGIDVVYYGNGQHLEYDFNVAPGADPSLIRLSFEGADSVSLNEQGSIVLRVGDREILQTPPAVYQRLASGELFAVKSSYVAKGLQWGIAVDHYDPSRELVVDPAIVYQTPIAGGATDAVTAIARDARGFLYLGGYTYSNDFPFGPISYSIFRQDRDAFVMKLDPFAASGSVIKYSTFFGGGLYEDVQGIAADSKGLIYFTGTTRSGDLPTANEYSKFLNDNDHPYIAVLDPTTDGKGGLVYSTYFGGAKVEQAQGFAVVNGKIYLAGWTTSDDLPMVNPYQGARAGGYDAFVAAFDITKTNKDTLVASTYLGGTGQDMARGLAIDRNGRVWLAGLSFSVGDFPTTVGAYKTFNSGAGDGFVAQLDLNAGTLLYASFIGGSGFDEAKRVVVEPSGRVAVTGYTLSPDFSTTSDAAQPAYAGNSDAFLAIIDPQAQDFTKALIYSTFFGGSDGDVAYDLKIDGAGRYYLAGYTLSRDLATTAGSFSPVSNGNGVDGFLAVINPKIAGARGLFYSTYITSPGFQTVQAIDVDADGNIYIGGYSTGNIYAGGLTNRFGDGNFDGYLIVVQP